jgi:hypothetical protein
MVEFEKLHGLRMERADKLAAAFKGFSSSIASWQSKAAEWLAKAEASSYEAAEKLGASVKTASESVARLEEEAKARQEALDSRLLEISTAKDKAVAKAKAQAEADEAARAELQARFKRAKAEAKQAQEEERARHAADKATADDDLRREKEKLKESKEAAARALAQAGGEAQAARDKAAGSAQRAADRLRGAEQRHREELQRATEVAARERRRLEQEHASARASGRAAADAAMRRAREQEAEAERRRAEAARAAAERKAEQERAREAAIARQVEANLLLKGALPRAGDEVVFVVDESGSMSRCGRWGSAVRETCSALDVLHGLGGQLGMMTFTSNPRVMRPDLVPFSASSVSAARAWLYARSPGGEDDFDRALTAALSMGPNQIYFLTDAGNSVSSSVSHAIRSGGVKLNCIVMGAHSHDLQSLATSTGGHYKSVADTGHGGLPPSLPMRLPMGLPMVLGSGVFFC